jgi:hypothetical protein
VTRTWRDAEATVESGCIVIRLRVKNIPSAMHHNPDSRFDDVRIVDLDEFVKDVIGALNDEAEGGTTPIHGLFDDAFDHAVADGSLGVVTNEVKP